MKEPRWNYCKIDAVIQITSNLDHGFSVGGKSRLNDDEEIAAKMVIISLTTQVWWSENSVITTVTPLGSGT